MELRGNVAITALAVALCRAYETEREDALFHDRLARPLVEAFGPGLQQHFTLDDDTLGALYANIAGRTAYFDEVITEGLRSATQVVLLGAGLDTRYERLPHAQRATWYEVDTGELLNVKAEVTATLSPDADARRVPVVADLLEDWTTPLARAGHDSSLPTVWVVEGVFSYLTDAQNDALVETLTGLSPEGSTLAATHWGPGKALDEYGQALHAATTQHGVGFQSWVADPVSWLGRWGWSTRTTTLIAQARRFDRSTEPVESAGREVGWLLAATR